MTAPDTQMNGTEDRDRVRAVRAGSLEAFDALVQTHQDRIYAYIRSRLPDRRDAEDLTQQVFVKAYRRLERYDEHRPFAAWLYGIARHEILSAVRRRREPAVETVDPVDPRTPASGLMVEEDRARLWTLAEGVLPEKQYTALWLVYRDDLDLHDAARVLNVTHTHIKVLLHRARRRLLGVLVEAGFNHSMVHLEASPGFPTLTASTRSLSS